MVTNCTLFWWLNFSKCQEWYLNMFSRPNFQVSICLTVIGRISPSTCIFINNISEFPLTLKTIWSLQQFKMPLKGFLNLVLVCKEISPRCGSDRIKVFFSTVVTWGRFMTNLLISILKHMSINDKYPFFKNTCLTKLSSSWSFVQSEQILKYR